MSNIAIKNKWINQNIDFGLIPFHSTIYDFLSSLFYIHLLEELRWDEGEQLNSLFSSWLSLLIVTFIISNVPEDVLRQGSRQRGKEGRSPQETEMSS